jgi:Fe-S oxidoreductase
LVSKPNREIEEDIMQLENVISTVENCRYCLMCRHVAPVERVTYDEALSPHGIALVIASVQRGLIKWNKDTVGVVYSASDNGNSRAHCVFNQPLPEAIAAARGEIVKLNLAPPEAYQVDLALSEWGTPYAKQKPQVSTQKGEIALFVGDEAQYLEPESIAAALRLLKKVGVEPVLIGVGRSNGYLASSLGFPETAVESAKAILAEVESTGAKLVLVLSPGDLFTLSQLYDERLNIQWPSDVKLQEVTEFLVDKLEGGGLKLKPASKIHPYAYVDPTHAVRVPNRHVTPRKLLTAVFQSKPLELFWRMDRSQPVGNTALQFTRPAIAQKLTLDRLEDARKSGAEEIITDDAGTLNQLRGRAVGYGLQVRGLYEVLADQL